ncbi:HTH domain-containing protein [Oscillibacter sp.]|uniref:HTH domain-containing protein n=1 Tax=Oscillibacter sp. TaxID=1945593 RepID=UPI0026348739|nr:HTH domain-containing protein [Oscillibacter sp.]MDD3347891.1 HTH domain-containing protein [Oscillibacter sp.]
MKIGVIGPESSASVIQSVVEKELPDIQLVLRPSEFFEESAAIAETFQNGRDVDALLFSGPTNYAYARKRLSPTIPWNYLPHNRTSAFQALFEAAIVHHSDLKVISVDRYEEPLLREVLEGAGIRDTQILRAPYDEETYDFEKKLLEFHRNCYREKGATVCITCMEHICSPLLDEGVPCVRVHPAQEVVQEQIYHLQLLNLSAMENQGRLAVIAIHFDYVFDDERDLFLREWEKMRYQNEFKERVYSIAQRLEAAVFGDGMDHFFIVTTRNMLKNVFLKNHEHAKLLQFGQRSDQYQVWLGMGVGDTMLEARSRAAMALNRAIADHSGTSYLVENEQGISGPLGTWDDHAAEHGVERLSERTGLGTATLKKLASALQNRKEGVTADQLAQSLSITPRSVNRIVARLEEAGCVTTVGKQTAGKGRPARVMKIALPDALYQK